MSDRSDSSIPHQINPVGFDPFGRRLSRDIRNSLSEALVQALEQTDRSCYLHSAERWFVKDLDDVHARYIKDRLERYDRAFDRISLNRIKDPKRQALIVWNQALFFEVHELLESVWHQTSGDEYQALKGLIQAAGVYIHLESNHRSAAERLVLKSLANIEKYPDQLKFIGNLSVLVKHLKNLDSRPPRLLHPSRG